MPSELARLAGPDALGRALVVAPGAPAPAPWADAERIVVDAAVVDDPGAAVARLQAHWSARVRYVVELAVPMGATKEATVDRRPAWALGPRYDQLVERLHHLIWSNAVDGRRTDAPVWWWGRKAIDLGARPGDTTDVVLPDGRPAWVDGGPLRAFVDDVDDVAEVEDVGDLDGGASADGGPFADRGASANVPPGRAALGPAAVVPGVAVERGSLAVLGTGAPHAALAPDQLAAVAHDGGGARIVAPAGSGKTRVLTERARHLLADRHVPAGALALVAFNVRAAGEMRERTTDLPGLRVQTLNGLGLSLLNGSGPFAVPAGRSGRTRVADERDVRQIIGQLVVLPRKTNTDPVAAWIDALAAVRLGLRAPAAVEAAFGEETSGLADMVPRYRRYLADHDLVDFDEQIASAAESLAADPEARAVAQRACRVLLVDEFQDLTPAHVLLVRLLAAPAFDVFGVGDDDQTIYGFSGASPEWLIDYPSLFPGAGRHDLHVNYRCPPAVVTAASHLLTHNRRRLAKRIVAAPGRADERGALTVVRTASPLTATVEVVRDVLAAGTRAGEVAVLARVNAALAPVQIALRAEGVPCVGTVDASFCERTGVRVALAWLRLASDPGRLGSEDLVETARRTTRRPSPRAIEWIAEKRSLGELRALADRVEDDRVGVYVNALDTMIAAARESTAAALATMRDVTGLDRAMDALDTAAIGRNRGGHGDDLDALVALAPMQPDAGAFERWLRAALRAPDPGDDEGERVTLATVHRVKGLEWPVVVVHDVSADQFPHRLADDVEEERRVFHVALTRASRRAVVVVPSDDPSPFVAELDQDAPPVADGAGRTGRVEPAPAIVRSRRRDAEPAPASEPLVEALKAWRNVARDGKPAYTVLTNESVLWIAAHRPRSLVALGACPGVGPAKLQKYGADVLALVERFAGE